MLSIIIGGDGKNGSKDRWTAVGATGQEDGGDLRREPHKGVREEPDYDEEGGGIF